MSSRNSSCCPSARRPPHPTVQSPPTHRAAGKEDEGGAAHGPARDVVQRVLALDAAARGVEHIEALEPHLLVGRSRTVLVAAGRGMAAACTTSRPTTAPPDKAELPLHHRPMELAGAHLHHDTIARPAAVLGQQTHMKALARHHGSCSTLDGFCCCVTQAAPQRLRAWGLPVCRATSGWKDAAGGHSGGWRRQPTAATTVRRTACGLGTGCLMTSRASRAGECG